jgi:multidrug efflux system membrane fusion protein
MRWCRACSPSVQLGAADRPRQAVLINDRAVGTDQSRKFVYVVTADNKAEYRQVTLGPVVDGLRVVRSGVKAGEKIVVNGLQRVHPGAPWRRRSCRWMAATAPTPRSPLADANRKE